jgi:hypothetical protein
MKFIRALHEQNDPFALPEEPADDPQRVERVVRRLRALQYRRARGDRSVQDRLEKLTQQTKIRVPPTGTKRTTYLDNPMFIPNSVNHWMGHPEYFSKWTSQRRTQYDQIMAILDKYNIERPTIMYYAEKPWYSGNRGKRVMARNLTIIGLDGKFIWRVYDSGSDHGAAQNSLYLTGAKYPTSLLLNGKEASRRVLLQDILPRHVKHNTTTAN